MQVKFFLYFYHLLAFIYYQPFIIYLCIYFNAYSFLWDFKSYILKIHHKNMNYCMFKTGDLNKV